MLTLFWFFLFFTVTAILAYHRASLSVWFLSFTIFLVFFSCWGESPTSAVFWGILLALIFLPLLFTPFRRRFLAAPLFRFYQTVMPSISRTEKEALNAGTVSWEGDLFSAQPNFEKLLAYAPPSLSEEEIDFLNGPVESLCALIDDWDITHHRGDLPPKVWDYIKKEGFFGLLIPKKFGGKGFSHFACSEIQIKIQARSTTVGTTVSVPNSLGPGELLLHYGTEEQKNYYLPRLARGEEVPCFALTSPDAGSDASAMTDSGVVCRGKFEGREILGIRLNWNKRYITLAPVATVIGLAFKLQDPEHLLGNKDEIGITCALIPRDTPGITIGRRHLPLDTPFQNGPTQGKDVFIPLDWIIGGVEKAGKGWQMLMECLAGGRGVSLPAATTSAAKAAVLTTGAYSRIRRQFKQPIVQFEGVGEVLGRMAGNLYIMEAARLFILGLLDKGERPAVASAIIKYQVTERARAIGNDAMDIQGGKGIILGPKNVIGRGYESIPIAITVEGANILTRNMIIFGQGAIRCHPYILAEYEAAHAKDSQKGLEIFDQAFFGHVAFMLSNFFRTFILGLTSSRICQTPRSSLKRYYQQILRYSAVFALLADIYILICGKQLKRRESYSARLGDILSHLYLLSAVLNHYYHQDEPEETYPLAKWASQSCIYEIERRIQELLENFPLPLLGSFLKWLIFPWGARRKKPAIKDSLKIARLFSTQTQTRQQLTRGLFMTAENNILADFEDALAKTLAAEPIEKIIRKAIQAGLIKGNYFMEQVKLAFEAHIISDDQYQTVLRAEEARQKIIAVDDFLPKELARA